MCAVPTRKYSPRRKESLSRVQVRTAALADIPALLALEASAATAAHWSENEYRRLLSESAHVVLVIGEDAVQGFIVGRELGAEWEIENVVVARPLQRRGLATQLVQELLSLARSRGAAAVYLEVRESNGAARALYSKLGFREAGRRKSYYSSPEEDAVVYRNLFPR